MIKPKVLFVLRQGLAKLDNELIEITMATTKNKLKTLLLQIRQNPKTRREEHESFCEYAAIDQKQLDILNVFDHPNFSPSEVRGYDALFVGGASEASVLQPEKYPFLDNCIELLKYCLNQNIPVFASCFGFQLAILALGGEILHESKNFEMGTIPIQTTKEAKTDPLFQNIPSSFYAVSVHREFAKASPENCVDLCFTDSCLHAFRVNNKPFWAFQFHPEVDKPTLVQRLTIFSEHYTENSEQLKLVLSQATETPHANLLVKNFIDYVLKI